jgi:WD40 repeat protein
MIASTLTNATHSYHFDETVVNNIVGNSFSEDGRHVLSGSTDGKLYIWPTEAPAAKHSIAGLPLPSAVAGSSSSSSGAGSSSSSDRAGTNSYHESFTASGGSPAVVTCACFVPEVTGLLYIHNCTGATCCL